MMTFDRIEAGKALGEHNFAFTDEAMEQWAALFPDDRQSLPAMPAAMVAMVVMRAFITILADRPPGNIHAGQNFWLARLPQIGNRLSTRLACIGKEFKNNRRWITFRTDTSDADGAPLFRGQMTTIWAA